MRPIADEFKSVRPLDGPHAEHEQAGLVHQAIRARDRQRARQGKRGTRESTSTPPMNSSESVSGTPKAAGLQPPHGCGHLPGQRPRGHGQRLAGRREDLHPVGAGHAERAAGRLGGAHFHGDHALLERRGLEHQGGRDDEVRGCEAASNAGRW